VASEAMLAKTIIERFPNPLDHAGSMESF